MNIKLYDFICPHCGDSRQLLYKAYWYAKNKSKYCKKCSPKNKIGLKKGQGWNKGLIGFNKGHPCYNDGKTFLGKIHTVESKEKMKLAKLGKIGSLANNWQGGKTVGQRARMLKEYNVWRMLVYKRDNFTCQKCGSVGKNLNAHHIKRYSKFPKLRLSVDNGLTLCKPCHVKLHRGVI